VTPANVRRAEQGAPRGAVVLLVRDIQPEAVPTA